MALDKAAVASKAAVLLFLSDGMTSRKISGKTV
jgi:hypothetical protein